MNDFHANEKVFEIYAVRMIVTVSGEIGIRDEGLTLEWESSVDVAIAPALASRKTSPLVFNMQLNATPDIERVWLIALMEEDLPLIGHVLEIRNSQSDFGVFCFEDLRGQDLLERPAPMIGALMLFEKNPIRELTEKSPFFANLWKQIEDLPTDRHWLCIVESPPSDWIEAVLPGDRGRFLREMGLE